MIYCQAVEFGVGEEEMDRCMHLAAYASVWKVGRFHVKVFLCRDHAEISISDGQAQLVKLGQFLIGARRFSEPGHLVAAEDEIGTMREIPLKGYLPKEVI